MLRVRFQERNPDGVWLPWDVEAVSMDYVRCGHFMGRVIGALYLTERGDHKPTEFTIVRDVQVDVV